MENVGIFYVHLVYFTAIGNILWPCFVIIWYIFPRFGMLYQEKSGNSALNYQSVVHRAHLSPRIFSSAVKNPFFKVINIFRREKNTYSSHFYFPITSRNNT
jgi:hypothetical protein